MGWLAGRCVCVCVCVCVFRGGLDTSLIPFFLLVHFEILALLFCFCRIAIEHTYVFSKKTSCLIIPTLDPSMRHILKFLDSITCTKAFHEV
jgi:hypothetical protein